jgi:hypothetical protein
MRILRFLITSLIVIAGLVGAALLVVLGLVVFAFNRLFGRTTPMPRFQASFRTSRPAQPRTPQAQGDVIDVIATDVKDDSARGQSRLNG